MCAFSAQAQPQFTSTNGPSGGEIQKLYHYPNLPFVFACTNGGLYRYSLVDTVWSFCIASHQSPFIEDLAYSVRNNTLFATSSFDTIYQSIDGGASWLPLAQSNGLPAGGFIGIRVNPVNDNVFVNTFQGVHYSNNNGLTWSPIDSMFINRVSSEFLEVDSLGTIYGFGYDADSLYSSTDNGHSWNPHFLGTDNRVYAVASYANEVFYGTVAGNIYRSVDRGANWTLLSSIPGEPITAISANSDELLIGTSPLRPAIYRSSNRGAAWETLYRAWGPISFTGIVRIHSTFLFSGSGFGGIISTNNGLDWIGANRGLHAVSTMDIAVSPSGNLYHTGWFGVSRKLATEEIWTLPDTSHGIWYGDILSYSDSVILVTTESGLRKSIDGGTQWNTVAFQGSYVEWLVRMRDDQLALRSNSGSYVSEDTGNTWRTLTTVPLAGIQKTQNGSISGIYQSRYYVSHDSGTTWSSNLIDPTFADFPFKHYIDEIDRAYLAGRGVMYSTNLGSTWIWSNFPDNPRPLIESIIQLLDGRFLCCSRSKIYVSYDRAVNWSVFCEPNVFGMLRYLDIDSSGFLYLATNENGIYRTVSPIVGVSTVEHPVFFSISRNYPNPFNSTTKISLSLTARSDLQMIIYNSLGQVVDRYNYQSLAAGNHTLPWNSQGKPSGIYFYQIKSNGVVLSQDKMTLIR